MTTEQKVAALLSIAAELAKDLPAGDDLRSRAVYLACSVYRNRYGKRPTQRIIDLARFGK